MASSSGSRQSFEDFIADYFKYLGFDGECFKREAEMQGHFTRADTWKLLYERYSDPNRSTDLPLIAMESFDDSSSRWYVTPNAKDFPAHRFDLLQDTISMNINGKETRFPMYYPNKIWDSFHEFIFKYLNFLGYHGIDFKYRSMDPKTSEFDRLAQFLKYVSSISYEDIFKELDELNDECQMNPGEATIEECLATYFVNENPSPEAAEIIPTHTPPGSVDTPPGNPLPGSADTAPGNPLPGSADTAPGNSLE